MRDQDSVAVLQRIVRNAGSSYSQDEVAAAKAALQSQQGAAGLAVLAGDVHRRFFWMVAPDSEGNHAVSHESVRKVVELSEAILDAGGGSNE